MTFPFSKFPIWLAAILLFCLSSCGEDVVETDAELIPYFELFAEEAAKRGIVVDYEAARIEGLMQEIDRPNVLGQCFRNEDKPRKVIIDIVYWTEATEVEREFLIFHELGHCFLDRDHLDITKTNSNECVSIMHSTPQACSFMLTDENREEYLDELFIF